MRPNKGEEYDIKTVPFIADIPINTIKLKIAATVMDEDDTFEVTTKISTADVREGMIAGDEWDFKNTKYVLADNIKGENYEY